MTRDSEDLEKGRRHLTQEEQPAQTPPVPDRVVTRLPLRLSHCEVQVRSPKGGRRTSKEEKSTRPPGSV